MVSVDELFPYVIPYVPGCSEPFARQAIIETAMDFCDKTLAMRETIDSFKTVAGLSQYDIDAPNKDLRVARVLSVLIEGKPANGVFSENAASLDDRKGLPMAFFTTRKESILQLNFYPVPDDKYTVSATVAYAPKFGATTVEDDLVNYWHEALVDGAVSRLAATPNMPFYNPDLAIYKRTEYQRRCNTAKIDSYHGKVRGQMTVRTKSLV